MKLSDLTKLEKLARSRNWRVRISSTTGIDYLPDLGSPGVSQAVASKLAARVKAIEHLGVYADPVVVGPDLAPIGLSQPIQAPVSEPPIPSRLQSLAASEGIDLDLLVNPDALVAAMSDTTIIR